MFKSGRISFRALFLVLAAACFLTACGGKTDSAESADSTAAESERETAEEKAERERTAEEEAAMEEEASPSLGNKVGISFPDGPDPRWRREGNAIASGLKSRGYDVTLSYTDGSVNQAGDIQRMLNEEVNLLIICPSVEDSLTEVLEGAREAGIPVISYDGLIRGTDAVSCCISGDRYTAGTLMAEYLVESLSLTADDSQEKKHIEFVAGSSSDSGAGLAFNGAYDVLKPYLDAGTLTVLSEDVSLSKAQVSSENAAGAKKRMTELITEYYSDGDSLDAVVCTDDTLASGVREALEESFGAKYKTVVTGVGGGTDTLTAVINGTQSMSVYLPAVNETACAVAAASAYLEGYTPDGSFLGSSGWNFPCVYDTSSFYNGSRMVPAFLLTPIAVTEENAQAELVDTGYFTLEDDVLREADLQADASVSAEDAAGNSDEAGETDSDESEASS